MARSGFKLKSGNISGGASFKAMGATPGESPAKLLGLLRWGWKAITKGKKVRTAIKDTTKKKDAMFNKKTRKLKDAYNKTDVDNIIKESADNVIAKKSLEYGGKTQLAKDVLTATGAVAGYKYMTRKDPDGSTVEVGVSPGEVIWDDEDSTSGGPKFKGKVPKNVKQ